MNALRCETVREKLRALSKGRLSPQEHREVNEHLQTCEACRVFQQNEQALDQALARMPPRRAPSSLKERLQMNVEPGSAAVAASRASKFPRRTLVVGVAATALGIALGYVGFSWSDRRASEELVNEAVNDHLRILYDAHATEVESGGLHQVKPWFEGRVDFAPVLDFEGDADLALTGGAVGYFIDRKAAVFLFKRRLHLVTLLVFRADGLPWPHVGNRKIGRVNAFVTRSRGFSTVLYRDGDLGYALTSDVDPATLEKLLEKVSRPPQ